MRIQHNITAMNAYRNYNTNTKALAKNLEKLSSGYRINRAGDDAAGLAISEKMRAQITGLEVAQKNAKDGISLVQTAEGAMTEVHDMLNRMYELAEQSANGTYADEVDREQMQKEIKSLSDEINRIADSTNFNGIKLLDGSLGEAGSVDLPQVGSVLGTDTILHKDGAAGAGGTSFSVDLHNTGFRGKAGDVMEIKIGGSTIKLEGATDGDLDSGMTAAEIAAAVVAGPKTATTGQYGLSVSGDMSALTAPAAAGDPTTVKIDGKEFTVEANGSRLTFTQKDAPKTEADVFDGQMDVTISGAGAIVEGSANEEVTGDTAAVYTTGTIAQGLTVGGKNTVVTVSYVDASGNKQSQDITFSTGTNATDTTTALKTALTGAGITGITFASTGTAITATSDDAGSAAAHVTGISLKTDGGDKVTIAAGSLVAGKDAGPAQEGNTVDLHYNTETTVVKDVGVESQRYASTWFQLKDSMISEGASVRIGNTNYTFKVDKDSSLADGGNTKVVDVSDLDASASDYLTKVANRLTDAAADNTTYTVGHGDTAGKITVAENAGQGDFDLTTLEGIESSLGIQSAGASNSKSGKALVLQIGDTSDSFNKMKVSIKDMHTSAMGIGNIDVGSQEGASSAMKAIQKAINYVSDVRGDLGSMQNRLDHTISNLSVMQENIQDAEATIRDVDVAEEMMAYTKNNILVQSAQAMLAQANQLPQGVLQLLQ